MSTKRLYLFAAIALILCSCAPKQESFEQLTERVMDLAVEKYIAIDQTLNQQEVTAFPRSTNPDGSLRTSDIGWWCTGFYPGTLWLIYEHTGDQAIRDLAEKYTLPLAQLKDRKTDHDIGFQINCSFGNGLRLTGEEDKYAQTMIDCAHKLALRFNDNTGTIKSWDFLRRDWRYPVII
ncbi:MAG: glucuronyl hydrolase, partial [Bacteroidales bacterium]|nr:glucuronyl hydrolase [Bacteroidales bacterium]